MKQSIATLGLLLSFSVGCKETTPKPTAPPEIKSDSSDAANQPDQADVGETVEEKPKVAPKFSQTLFPSQDLEALALGQPIGKISGEIYGSERDVVAVSHVSCGDGAVLQAVFKTEDGIRISPPMGVRFLDLATKKEVIYDDGEFKVSVNFDVDTEAQLKGTLRIFYSELGVEKEYVKLTVDAKPLRQLFEPKLDGKGVIPKYANCTPTGYFTAEIDGLPKMKGLVAAVDVGSLGVPKIRVPFDSQNGIDIFLIPLKKGETFQNAKFKMETSRVKGQNPAVLQAAVYHVAELGPASGATGFNLDHTATEGIYEGTATATLSKTGAEITIENFSVAMGGPYDGYKIKKLQIETGMVSDKQMTFELGKAPQWWK